MKLHFHGKNTILRHNDRKQNQFFCERTKTKKKISSANFPFKKKKRALKFQKTRSFLSLRASGRSDLSRISRKASHPSPPPSLVPALKFLIGERCVISAAAWIMRDRVPLADRAVASGGEREGGREWRANVARWHTVASAAQQIKDRRWIITSPLPGYRA